MSGHHARRALPRQRREGDEDEELHARRGDRRALRVRASGDVVTAGAASKLCQADHAKSDKPLFDSLAKRCAAKYATKSGTMYQSAAAFCELDVAVLLSRLNAKVD